MDTDFFGLEGFEWDTGNVGKNLEKHGISTAQAEEIFFHFYTVFPDPRHSAKETRYGIYGVTNMGEILFIAFAVRNRRIRIISARSANKKERYF